MRLVGPATENGHFVLADLSDGRLVPWRQIGLVRSNQLPVAGMRVFATGEIESFDRVEALAATVAGFPAKDEDRAAQCATCMVAPRNV